MVGVVRERGRWVREVATREQRRWTVSDGEGTTTMGTWEMYWMWA
jgi:hypothetical protein